MLRSLLVVLYLAVSVTWPIGENPTPGDPFLIVNAATNQLAYIHDGQVKDIQPAATGKNGTETPMGLFTITVKAEQPYYRKKNIAGGHPDNPLGSRWIGFDALDTDGRTFGVHGTNRPDSVGYPVTSGCIRLSNEKVEQLYMHIPIGTKILITDQHRSFEELAIEHGAISK